MEGYVQWPKEVEDAVEEETKEKWAELLLFEVLETDLKDLEKRVTALESAVKSDKATELHLLELDGELLTTQGRINGLQERINDVSERQQREHAMLLLEGVINANQGSSEWCLGYLRRAIGRGLINRDYAEHLLFNVVRVSGYWRDRFDEMFPKEG